MNHESGPTSCAISSDAVWRDVDTEVVILNVQSGQYYGLDEVGSRVWHLTIDHGGDLQKVREALQDEFDVEPATLERDLRDLLSRLSDAGLVTLL